jgi:hypothetical protein
MLTALGFEIAIKDILKGDEITNDYGTFNIIEPFQCAHGPHEREFVRPDDLVRFHEIWDNQIQNAFSLQGQVIQPLLKFLSKDQISQLGKISNGTLQMPSVKDNFFAGI